MIKSFSNSWKGILISFIAITFSGFISHKLDRITPRLICLFILLLTVLPRMILAISTDSLPWNDFGLTLDVAKSFVSQGFHYLESIEMTQTYPYLIPWIFLESIFIKIFPGDYVIVMRLVISFLCGFTGILIFLFGNTFSKRIGISAAILYALMPSSIVFSSVISNQHFSTFTELLALYLLFCSIKRINKKTKYIYSIISGLLLGIGQLIRPDALPILAGTCIFLIQILIKYRNKIFKKNIIIQLVILVLMFSITTQFTTWIIHNSMNLPDEIQEPGLGFKIYLGLSYKHGKFNFPDAQRYLSSPEDFRQELLLTRIKDYILHPIKFVELTINKYYFQWGDYSSAFEWLKGEEISKYISSAGYQQEYEDLINSQNIFNNLDSGYYFWFSLFAFIGVLSLINNRRNDKAILLLTGVSILYIMAFILIEVQPRYRYFILPILSIFSGLGLTCIFVKIGSLFLRITERKFTQNLIN